MDVNEYLAEKPSKNKQQVNHAVSFNAIKNQALELLYSNKPTDEVIECLENLFVTNPVSIRNEREVPRRKPSARHLLNFAKRLRKFAF